ncbi:MAG: 6-phosphofructokinase [Bacteroidia bacterium]
MKKLLILTGGGDCPGLNAVIRAVYKAAIQTGEWEVYGSIEAFNGLLRSPQEIVKLDHSLTGGIHYRGGTILGTTNKGNPFDFPVEHPDGSWGTKDRSAEVVQAAKDLGIEAVISVGGDGSQRISQRFFEMGLPVVGVPKTIDNDLSATDMTFGFQTAVQIATESVDKLVTTAASHNRTMIMEVMGRDAGWIALHAAIAGGAEVCLIPEIPFNVEKVVKRLNGRYKGRRGFSNVIIAEGAKPLAGTVVGTVTDEAGYEHVRLGGVGYQLAAELKAGGFKHDTRVCVLGHLQRGGVPTAFDRVLASSFGVKAFELAAEGKFGRMVALKGQAITDVSLKEAVEAYNYVDAHGQLVSIARSLGISFGDE